MTSSPHKTMMNRKKAERLQVVRFLHLIKSLRLEPLLPGPFKKAYDKQQSNSAYCCYHQVPDNSAACAKSKCAEAPASQKRPNHSNNQVYEQAKTTTFHHLSGQPPSYHSDDYTPE